MGWPEIPRKWYWSHLPDKQCSLLTKRSKSILDNGDRTSNEVVKLCSNVYDDTFIGDTPFIGTPDEGLDSDELSEHQSLSDKDLSDNNWNDITEGISISNIFIYLFDSATLRILQIAIFKIAFTSPVSKNIVGYTCGKWFYTRVTAFSLMLESTLSQWYRKLLFSVFVHFDTSARVVHCDTSTRSKWLTHECIKFEILIITPLKLK